MIKKLLRYDEELFDALNVITNNKSAGNDGLTKEFYVTFWSELNSTNLAYQKGINYYSTSSSYTPFL